MSALLEVRPLLVDLRQVRAEDLDPLLDEEAEHWERELDWDFRPLADLVRRFVRMQALSGYVLAVGRKVVGCCYYVSEEHKGLIGDLYVMDEWSRPELEAQLLTAVLRAMFAAPQLKRVESQLMMLSEAARERMPFREWLQAFTRNFMVADLKGAAELPRGKAAAGTIFERWHEREREQAARLIVRAYQGHVDAEINDQYRSASGARRFLTNIVQYPGCGSFFQQGSYVALDAVTGQLSGLSLASLVAFDVGHITQVCVDPAVRGSGVGYELMRHCMNALAEAGCRKVSLTVTASNAGAIALYERLGFRVHRSFDAIVWANEGVSLRNCNTMKV